MGWDKTHTMRELLVIENVPQKNIAPMTITYATCRLDLNFRGSLHQY